MTSFHKVVLRSFKILMICLSHHQSAKICRHGHDKTSGYRSSHPDETYSSCTAKQSSRERSSPEQKAQAFFGCTVAQYSGCCACRRSSHGRGRSV